MKPTLLVLAAGMGSRYGGLKQMDGLGPHGETIIDYSIYDAVQAGFGKVVYIVREYFLEQFKETVAKKYSHVKCLDGSPLEFLFVTQELDRIPSRFSLNPERQKPWGTAHAVLMAKDVIDGPFVVINGDDFYGKESFRIAGEWCRAHENSKGVYAIVGFELDNTLSESGGVSRGICHYDPEGHLTDVVEHTNAMVDPDGILRADNTLTGERVEVNAKDLCSMNMWCFTPDYFTFSSSIFEKFLELNINELKKEYYIPYAIDCIIKDGSGKCDVLSTPSHWFGVTFKEDRPGVVAKFAELVEQGIYPSPLHLRDMRRLKHPNYNFFANFTWFVPDARKLVVLVIWIIVGAIAGNVISSILLLSLGREAGMEYATLISYPMIFIPAMIFASSKSHYYSLTENGVKLDSSNFAPHSGLLCALVVVAGTLCTAFCADAIAALLPEMPDNLKDLLESMTSGTLWINFLCVSIFAPVFEEWLCRGMVLRGLLANKVKPVWAIVISAVFFAVIHLNPWQAVPAFLLGALFGYVYYKTGSLKLTMLMHFVNNTFALVMTRIPGLEDAEGWKDVFSAPVYGALLAACTAAALLCVYFFSKVKIRNASGGCESVPPLFENNNQ